VNGRNYSVKISKAAVFSNFLGIKRKLDAIPAGFKVTIDLEDTLLVDHSVMENLHQFRNDYERGGGKVNIVGLEGHEAVSSHSSAARVKIGN
jgi:MFS superfamily sulfate permease-like transporter